MESIKHVTLNFTMPFNGEARNDGGYAVKIDETSESAKPYDLLLMALGSCLYSTFEDILVKKRLDYIELEIDITGEKREEVPTTLKYCNVVFKIRGDRTNEKNYRKALELACKYCSIYNTLNHVARMKAELNFI